ncbi:MAG: hypothetical protein IJ509_00245 [Bacilli bacterium]|nr:hypothetical protein [Bacilli bacterium]
MDKELKQLVVEIISLTILLIVVVPICVQASNDYQEKRDVLLNGTGTSVDISHNGKMKKVTVYSEHDDVIRVNLILKITKFANDYEIYLDEEIYNIRDLDYTEDNEYQYYNLGIYEVDEIREFDFQLRNVGKNYYDETITYSFMTEGLL